MDLKYSGIFACALATFAAIQEGHLIRTGAMQKKQTDKSETAEEK
jgi:hypothetical protein